MFGPQEAWLALGAMAFYVGDSMVLLYADQLLLERVATGWWPRRGSSMLLAGRRPFLPNPFAPQRPLLQLSLARLLGGSVDDAGDVRRALGALSPLRTLATVLLVLFALMPGLLYAGGTGGIFLAWLAAVYAVAIAMSAALWQRRDALGLSRSDVAKLAFECIACAPMAINIVRRLTRRLPGPTLADVGTLLDAPSFHALCGEIDAMLQERMVELDAGDAAIAQLVIYRQRLQTAATP